jgi:putative DNA primase/helicase
MTMLLDAALAYARAGLPVFPVRNKTPLTPHGFKDATRDEDTIRRWWAADPGAGIGIPMGSASGLVVLDVDPRHGGDESLEALLGEHGLLPRGPVARTGGGGEHRYFAHPGGNLPPVHGFRPGLDLQGDGSYVVAPPSRHLSGGTYEWVVPLVGGPRPPLPPTWLLRAAPPPAAPRRFTADPDGRIPHGWHHEFIVQTAASFASRIAGISEEVLLRHVRGAIRAALDDADSHERETADAVRSAYAKYGRPAPPSDSARPDTGADPVRTPEAGGAATPPGPSAPADRRGEAPIPDGLFVRDEKTGEWRPDRPAFVGWFRDSEAFVVPIERGTFARGSFELLRYEGGYYNGEALSLLQRRTEDAFRRRGLTSNRNFVAEVTHGVARTSEFHRRRKTFNPPGLLCLENGLLDLRTLRPPTPHPDPPPADYPVFTWKLPVAYDPTARCERFDRFVEEIMPGSPEKQRLLVDLLGYCLMPANPFHLFFVFVGDGGNGKTTFGKVVQALLGPEAVSTLTLQQVASNRFAPAELDGRLVNLCDDLPYNRPLEATGVLKMVTGEGTMTVEHKFQHPFNLRYGGKLISMANRTPPTNDDTVAFWRRAVVIPFDATFLEDDPRRDPALEERLVAERSGILNRAIEGLKRVQARLDSRGRFDPQGLFSNSKEEWRMRSDPIRQFVLATRETGDGQEVDGRVLYHDYVVWCQENDETPVTDNTFGKRLRRVPLPGPLVHVSQHERKRVAGNDVWVYTGIGGPKGVASQNGLFAQTTLAPPGPGNEFPGKPVLTSDGVSTSENRRPSLVVASQTLPKRGGVGLGGGGVVEPGTDSLATTSDWGVSGPPDPTVVSGVSGPCSAESESGSEEAPVDAAPAELVRMLEGQGPGPFDRESSGPSSSSGGTRPTRSAGGSPG